MGLRVRALLYALSVAMFAFAAAADNPNTPVIFSASVDSSVTTLTIGGSNFGSASAPRVTLNSNDLTVTGFTDTEITATLPVNLAPASYLLAVYPAAHHQLFGVFVVTVGAQGPQGPPGPGVGTGTVGKLAKFTTSTTLGDSSITEASDSIDISRPSLKMSGHGAIGDLNDGFLRLNQGGDYPNGILTGGQVRADGGFVTLTNTGLTLNGIHLDRESTFAKLTSANNSAGGVHVVRSDGASWGYFYADSTGIGILNGGGTFALRASGAPNSTNSDVTLYTDNGTPRLRVDASGTVVQGDLNVTGTLTKGAGTFKIDDPIDPDNKYLSHSFVESPDMMNIYNGMVTLDSKGEASVDLPAWFEALNRDFRYQLTAIGAPSPNLFVASEIAGNRFKIAGGAAGAKVSWQVTGIRHDPFANAHRTPVEQEKPLAERGHYLYPDVYAKK